MPKKNAIEKATYINKRYKEYLRSSFHFGNRTLQQKYEEELASEPLFKGPYVALNLPFKRGKNLNQLIQEGIVCKSFKRLDNIDFDRPLYAHQEKAVRQIGKGRSAIITTGTGSGKTECFLYPIINELLSDAEKGNHDIGIRAMFLYPMNALVNDQVDRIRKILSNCPQITYGFFTGDTPETASAAFRSKYAEMNGGNIPDNEIISRKEIRETPPHLLFTNYSMLEYLMIRPNDYAVFTKERLKNWKYVVLDEAHTYHGSLGIELAMLLRRVTGLADRKPRFILTSATLGEKGKSEEDIVAFGKSLTSANFSVDDIIFSERIYLDKSKLQYRVEGKDYLFLKEHIDDLAQVQSCCSKYGIGKLASIREYLFELLSRDKNVGSLYKELAEKSVSFSKIADSLKEFINSTELVALIDLINMSEKNGIGIFDLKYHSFVRPLSGAYVTLCEPQQLSLTKTNSIGEYKAFEIGNCKYCGAPYIIGKILPNEEDGLEYLIQNKEVDIYENYGDNKHVELDYFLLDSEVNEESNQNLLMEYAVCAKCGQIHPKENLNAERCSCDEKWQKIVYKVVDNRANKKGKVEKTYNNINICPCCGRDSRGGVVKSLNVGKDEGTALIAQILLEAIDDGNKAAVKKKNLTLQLGNRISRNDTEQKVKQFLAFSDSRQQASFAAAFLDANHIRLLQKRLIWEVIKNNDYRDVPVDALAAQLTDLIKKYNLFDNGMTPHKNAWVALLYELLRVDGVNDGEGLGLFYFDIDLSDLMSNFEEEDVEEVFGKYNITKKDLETMMQVVFGVFKTTPAINYVHSSLTPQEKLDNLEFRRFDNRVIFESPKTLNGVHSFIPVKGNQNGVIRYVMKACHCSEEEARDILQVLFINLGAEGLFHKDDFNETYQIDAENYVLRNYKKSKYYRCSKCGRLTPHNVHDTCVRDKCDGKLVEVNPDDVLADNYYRNQYTDKKIERIIVKEHTAQLDRKKAKQYQNDFKNKKINILSCSTTFEMGIDIGELETVFMRNVPPTPANYVQRAGRAGRRKDSSAFILTYCGTSSHDYTYFAEPEKMISGVINPPYFNIQNRKIITRHLMATCLGYFFRNNPEYFIKIDQLVFGDGVEKFNSYVSGHPADLVRYIDEKVLPEPLYSDYHMLKWFSDMGNKDEKLVLFAEIIRNTEKEYKDAQKAALNEEKYQEADYFKKQIEYLHGEKTIQELSKYCVIPKYGFPVDVVELQIYQDGRLLNKYDLTRDLRIAISEYAPESEIIVDGTKYTSQYITLPKAAPFPKQYFCECENCRSINVFLSPGEYSTCRYCGESIVSSFAEYFIEPVEGFKTGITKESTRMKPRRTYAGEVSYLGQGIQDDNKLNLNGALFAVTSTDDELLVMNRSKFYSCPVCGYSEVGKRNTTPSIMKGHKNYRQYDCPCDTLNKLKLGHRFRTDVARFTIPLLIHFDKKSYFKALSFLYAFLEGISSCLEIERNDIDGLLTINLDEGCYDVIVYDNVPGGAGHVKRLMSKSVVVGCLKAGLHKVSLDCCDENTSCYSCLRNYYNQQYHSKLQRRYAKEAIRDLLQKII